MYLGGGRVNIYANDGSGTVVGTQEVADAATVTAVQVDGSWADAQGVWHAPGGGQPGGPIGAGLPGGGQVPGPGPGLVHCSVTLEYCGNTPPCVEETTRQGSCEGLLIEDLSHCPDHRTHNRDECTADEGGGGGGGGGGGVVGGVIARTGSVAGIPSTYLVYGAIGLVLYLLLKR